MLSFVSANASSKSTIVLLHGLMSSNIEYAAVTPHLSSYHLLLPDLPGHASSSDKLPFTLRHAADMVADLISQEAHDGRAYVVGLSAGGFVALELAKTHPELVTCLFVTGAAPLRGWQRWFASRPRLLGPILGLSVTHCPDWIYRAACSYHGVQNHEELLAQMRANIANKAANLVRDGYLSIVAVADDDAAQVKARALSIASGLQDNVDATRYMGKALRRGNDRSRSVVFRKAIHTWDLQHPKLFAEGVKAWYEERPLPEEFEELS